MTLIAGQASPKPERPVTEAARPGRGGGSGAARGGMLGLEGVPLASAAPGSIRSVGVATGVASWLPLRFVTASRSTDWRDSA
jgi:hypothetical protein